MPRGRKPTGERALTGAERQARYRAARAGQPGIRYPRRTRPRAKSPQQTDRRSRPQRWRDALAAPCRTGGVYCLARQAAGRYPELGNWRSAASDCRSRSRRTERHRAAARLWPRLSLPMIATWHWLRPLHSRLTRQSTRDITPTTRWVTPPRPPSDRNGGRFQIGMGGRFQIGIPGRIHRNPH